jgi:hypothetical protein
VGGCGAFAFGGAELRRKAGAERRPQGLALRLRAVLPVLIAAPLHTKNIGFLLLISVVEIVCSENLSKNLVQSLHCSWNNC